MKKILIVTVILLAGITAFGRKPSITKNSPHTVNMVHRNIMLEKKVFKKADDIRSFLKPEARAKLDRIIRDVQRQIAAPGHVDPYAVTQREVVKMFSELTPQQLKMLCFYVLAEIARTMAASDDSGQLTEERQVKLQQLMDDKSQAENTLSNILKAFENTQRDLVSNLK